MDTFTHGLLGALTLRSLPTPGKNLSLPEVSILAFVAALFPDIDYLMFWIHPLQFLAEWHRAATHSLLMMPVWSVIIGFIAAVLVRARWKWPMYSAVCAIAITTHILSDIITIYGTQILNPLSDYKAVIGTTFFIDGYFTGIVLAGLFGSVLLNRHNSQHQRRFSGSMILMLIAYLGLQSYFRSMANDFGNEYIAKNRLNDAVVHSLPQPFSPTYWKIIVETNENYQVSFVNIMRAGWHDSFTFYMTKLLSGNSPSVVDAVKNYFPVNKAEWVTYQKLDREDEKVSIAWNHNEFEAFRKFAVFPVVYRKDSSISGSCVWFTDLRYVFPVMLPPFRYGMCEKSSQWSPYRLQRHTINKRIGF